VLAHTGATGPRLGCSRRRRIALGSGVTLVEVNRLLKQFGEMRKMMRSPKKMKKMMGGLGGMAGGGMPGGGEMPDMGDLEGMMKGLGGKKR
jgi:signal recognition particle subunit SRP54